MNMNGTTAPAEWWRTDAPAVARGACVPARRAASGAPFWWLVALTVVMLLAPQDFMPALAPLRIALLSAVGAAAAYVFDRLKRGQPVLAIGSETRWCLVLVAWAIATVPFAIWPGGSVNLLTDLYLKSVIVFWLLGSIVRSSARLRQIAWVLSLIAVPLALTGIMHFLSGDFHGSGADARILGYDAGLVKNPNDLALVLNLILPLTVALLMTERAPRHRAELVVIACCEAAGVVATFSRSGFITLAAIGMLLIWRIARRAGSRWIWAVPVVALLALPALPGGYMERLSTITDKDSDPTGSAQTRWNDQVVAVGYVLDHPVIGAGIGNDVLAMNALRGAKWKQVHDLYLEYAVDLGLPGLVIFIVVLSQCLSAVNAVQRRCLGAPDARILFAISEGVWISLLAFALAAFFHPIAYHVYFYYMAGLAVAAKAACQAEVRA